MCWELKKFRLTIGEEFCVQEMDLVACGTWNIIGLHLEKTKRVVPCVCLNLILLAPAYDEFGYNEHPEKISKFLCIKLTAIGTAMLKSSVTKSTHLERAVSFAFFTRCKRDLVYNERILKNLGWKLNHETCWNFFSILSSYQKSIPISNASAILQIFKGKFFWLEIGK